ncbi:MAG: ComEC/Rec2 family competence protein, partial [Clostridia bacterium]|nr:ComEC/Rec2 family competence protein [Clostridia bacterium]
CNIALSIVFSVVAAAVIAAAFFVKSLHKARVKLIIISLTFLIASGVSALNFIKVENTQIYSYDSVIEGSVSLMTECDENGNVNRGEYYVAYIYLEDVEVDGRKIKGIAQAAFSSPELISGLKIGDRIEFRGNISPKNLCVTDSYSVNSYKNNIFHYVSCAENPDDESSIFKVLYNKVKFGDKIRLKIKSSVYGNVKSETAGFLYAMTLGDKSGLEDSIKTDFQRTGAAHIFAVSGLHVGIIAASLLLALKKLKVRKRSVIFFVVAAVLVPFCALCGFSPSTVRATVMTLIALGAKTLMYRSDGISNLSLAGCVILLSDPIYLFDVGFLMSFLAVYGLLTLTKPMLAIIPKRLHCKLTSLLCATFAVNISLLPLMVMTFGGQTLLSLVANLVVIPIASIFFPIYLLALIITCMLPFAGILLTIAGAPFTLMIALIGKLGEAETAVIYFRSSIVFIILFIGLMLLLSKYFFADRKIKKIVATALALCIFLSVALNVTRWGNENALVLCYSDKYGSQYAFVENVDGGRYLVVNGRFTDDTVAATRDFMNKKGFARVDGIAVVGEDPDSKSILKLAQSINCMNLYAFASDEFSDIAMNADNHVVEDGFTFAFINSGTLEIVAGKSVIRILADDYYSLDENYNILITYDAQNSPEDGKYVVCDTGYTNSLQNYLPATFTFRLNNGKILISQIWRY